MTQNQSSDFIEGQRWVSDTETGLGLGVIVEIEFRHITIMFPAAGETRIYSRDNSPLTRIAFSVGDRIKAQEQWMMTVESVTNEDGYLTYQGKKDDGSSVTLEEMDLDNRLRFNTPKDRLFAGQLDNYRWYRLRTSVYDYRQARQQSPIRGLSGARVAVIPHQIYIAAEVSERLQPRVLLADEVGLGKTIEAGMILQRQLSLHRISRVLVVVPESLIHQWLVEMLRKFNLRFHIIDKDRFEALGDAPSGNPFLAQQLVLCSLETLVENEKIAEAASAADWDCLTVDEAHHLQWEPDKVSEEYRVIEAIARVTPSVLLLTATPEQLGQASHFARLKLLDPERYPDLKAFREEERHFENTAGLANSILSDETIEDAQLDGIGKALDREWTDKERKVLANPTTRAVSDLTDEILSGLIDRHGTGRVLFRNSRNTISGFPERHLTPHELGPVTDTIEAGMAAVSNDQDNAEAETLNADDIPTASEHDAEVEFIDEKEEEDAGDGIEDLLKAIAAAGDELDAETSPSPPTLKLSAQNKSHATWLRQLLACLDDEKLLVICSSPDTVLALQESLRLLGTECAVFHEGMSIVERDRSAAWFADTEDGCRLLICSEIGSEGRNFQYLHHLVLLELPENPDLLEQRIGRLDRIGQLEDIQIHVPYTSDSHEHHLMRWYHEGLDAFETCCRVGGSVKREIRQDFDAVFEPASVDAKKVDALIQQTKQSAELLNQQLDAGRDRLLELNSNRVGRVQHHLDMLEREERDFTLQDFMASVFDCFGVDYEEQTNGSWIAKPSDNMHVEHFPGISDGGATLTFQRAQALAREDLLFLTWDHPMVENAMDMILDEALGQANATAISNSSFPKNVMLIDATYTYECIADRSLDIGRYLSAGPERFLLGSNKKDYTGALAELDGNSVRQKIELLKLKGVIKGQQDIIRFLLDHSEKLANAKLADIVTEAQASVESELQTELDRLLELKKINPSVREDEISALQNLKQASHDALQETTANLVTVRVLVNV